MAKQEPEYLLRVTIDVLYRASQEQITTFLLGEFPTVRAAEKLRDCLCRYNPDYHLLIGYTRSQIKAYARNFRLRYEIVYIAKIDYSI